MVKKNDQHVQPSELSFTVADSHFAAQAWGNENDLPILALHGWLDNSSSFFALAPQIKNAYIVAIDMAAMVRQVIDMGMRLTIYGKMLRKFLQSLISLAGRSLHY